MFPEKTKPQFTTSLKMCGGDEKSFLCSCISMCNQMVTNYVSKLFEVFIRDRIDREPHSLKYVYTLNLAYKVQNFSDYSAQYLLESFLMFSCVFKFAKASFCALTSSCSRHFKTSSPSWYWDVRKVAMAIL